MQNVLEGRGAIPQRESNGYKARTTVVVNDDLIPAGCFLYLALLRCAASGVNIAFFTKSFRPLAAEVIASRRDLTPYNVLMKGEGLSRATECGKVAPTVHGIPGIDFRNAVNDFDPEFNHTFHADGAQERTDHLLENTFHQIQPRAVVGCLHIDGAIGAGGEVGDNQKIKAFKADASGFHILEDY